MFLRGNANGCYAAENCKRRALVICAHLRLGRKKRRSRYLMQPITGLHIGSLIDHRRFDVRLYHEDWHGPFDPAQASGDSLVFLTGLQADFDRMRQLSYVFRRAGSTVIAGGICTLFPDFAAQFFDAICVGGVDSVPQVVADYERGNLKRIYRSPANQISPYTVDYSLLAKSGISPSVHLMEGSRGCSFRCTFCVIPAEIGGHAGYDTEALSRLIDSAISTSPIFSFRRCMDASCSWTTIFQTIVLICCVSAKCWQSNRKICGWLASITQNILHDRPLIERMAKAKCIGLFAGLVFLIMTCSGDTTKHRISVDVRMLSAIFYLRNPRVLRLATAIFDPRFQVAAEMEQAYFHYRAD